MFLQFSWKFCILMLIITPPIHCKNEDKTAQNGVEETTLELDTEENRNLFANIKFSDEEVRPPPEGIEEQLKSGALVEEEEEKKSVGVHYATSPLHMVHLAQREEQIYNILGDYEQALMERLEIVRRYRWDYEDSVFPVLDSMHPTSTEWEQAAFLVAHPLFVYRILQRNSVHLRSFYRNLFNNVESDAWEKLEAIRGTFEWPRGDDLREASKLIIRLQHAYNLNPQVFANGGVRGLRTRVGLTALQCVELAEYVLTSTQDTLTAGQWLKAARQKIIAGDETASQDYLQTVWDNTVRLHGKTWNIDDFSISDVFHEANSVVTGMYEEQKFNLTNENRIQNYKALCRGEIPRMRRRPLGHCYLDTSSDLYFLINPQLVEIHSWDPRIIQIHSFFYKNLTDEIIASAFSPLLSSSEDSTPKEQAFLASVKSATSAYTFHSFPSVVLALKKIKSLTGLQKKDSKGLTSAPFAMSVTPYAAGGHYEPCYFCEEEDGEILESFGRRTATVDFFLDNVEAGGETVFTLLGLSIGVEEGSVLIYHNVNPARKHEDFDYRLLRGGCPVLIGQKWVASYFIHEYDGRQCPLSRN